MAHIVRVVRLRSRRDAAQQLAQSVTNLVSGEPPPGLLRTYVVRDLGDSSVVMLMSVFESLEAMAVNTSNLEASLTLLQPMLIENTQISSYEVLTD